MKTRLIAAILIALSIPTAAHAEKTMSDAELHRHHEVMEAALRRLRGRGGQAISEKACMKGMLQDVKEVDDLQFDDTVSEQMWDVCKAESGFNYSNDWHAWAACMRIARTRHGLRDY
jgi:hypothetical protein